MFSAFIKVDILSLALVWKRLASLFWTQARGVDISIKWYFHSPFWTQVWEGDAEEGVHYQTNGRRRSLPFPVTKTSGSWLIVSKKFSWGQIFNLSQYLLQVLPFLMTWTLKILLGSNFRSFMQISTGLLLTSCMVTRRCIPVWEHSVWTTFR